MLGFLGTSGGFGALCLQGTFEVGSGMDGAKRPVWFVGLIGLIGLGCRDYRVYRVYRSYRAYRV